MWSVKCTRKRSFFEKNLFEVNISFFLTKPFFEVGKKYTEEKNCKCFLECVFSMGLWRIAVLEDTLRSVLDTYTHVDSDLTPCFGSDLCSQCPCLRMTCSKMINPLNPRRLYFKLIKWEFEGAYSCCCLLCQPKKNFTPPKRRFFLKRRTCLQVFWA